MSDIVTYWDHEERDRAAMTAEEVELYLNAELMTKGVLRVKPPTLLEEVEPQIERESYFKVGEVLFETSEQAEAYLRLNPRTRECDYSISSGWGKDWNYVAKAVPPDLSIVRCLTEQQALTHRVALSKLKEAKDSNAKAKAEYTKASEASEKVLKGVWEDWHRCRRLAEKFSRIQETRKEYQALSHGNLLVAEDFLLKTFSRGELEEADEWLGAVEATV